MALNRLRRIQKSNEGERTMYVLLSAAGKSVSEIANHVNRNAHTIRVWLKRYVSFGLNGLQARKKRGRPAKKAPVIESQLGSRTLVAFKLHNKAFFIYGFAKNKRSNITLKEELALKTLAKLYFTYDEKQIDRAIKAGELIEVFYEKINT